MPWLRMECDWEERRGFYEEEGFGEEVKVWLTEERSLSESMPSFFIWITEHASSDPYSTQCSSTLLIYSHHFC